MHGFLFPIEFLNGRSTLLSFEPRFNNRTSHFTQCQFKRVKIKFILTIFRDPFEIK